MHAFCRDGRLEIGDEVLFINGQSLATANHKDAVQFLQSASNPVQLVISRKVNALIILNRFMQPFLHVTLFILFLYLCF